MQRHYTNDTFDGALCGETKNIYNRGEPIHSDEFLSLVDCPKCAKIVGKRKLSESSKKIEITPCRGGWSPRGNGELRFPSAVFVDGKFTCTMHFTSGFGGGWSIMHPSYVKSHGKLIPHAIYYATRNTPYYEYHYPKVRNQEQLKKYTDFHRGLGTYASKELAAYAASIIEDVLLTEAEAKDYAIKFYERQDKAMNKQKEKHRQSLERSGTLHNGIKDLYNRNDLTNFQRSALLIAMEELLITPEEENDPV